MSTATNPLSNTSYTSKDFETIYPELLNLVKELTYKWDPSISNESDPGVILLKLNALIADKLNYNIDKNVLECFPESVTQLQNARQLFEQLGYFMHWYRSATTDVSFKWTGEASSNTYTIPPLTTMVMEDGGGNIYTLLGPSEINANKEDDFTIGSQLLACDGSTTSFKAIQGVATLYDINGITTISTYNLDSNNRLYFDNLNVAENGIFIANIESGNYNEWKRKDNLLVENLGNKFYKFGVNRDGTSCYLEFPVDAEKLFGSGINIVYVNTLGDSGNVAAGILNDFYNPVIPIEDTSMNLNSGNVTVRNYNAAVNGRNVESINEGYRNYKKVLGTFNTLVTLRDYINAIYNSGLISNGFVCDRTNDIQTVTDIVSNQDGISQHLISVDRDDPDDGPLLSAFSLKLYMLQYGSPISSLSYNNTFSMADDSTNDIVKAYLEDVKSISHDYADILPEDFANNKPNICLFKNKYPINCRVITQYALTNAQALEVRSNIQQAIFNAFNAKEVDFGAEIDYDALHATIKLADERIKSIILDDITYTTYAVYLDHTDDTFKEIDINDPDDPSAEIIRTDIYAKSVLAGVTQLFVRDEEFDYKVNQEHIATYSSIEELKATLSVSLSGTGNVATDYILRDNEYIQLFSPNLLNITTFSNYVKFEAKLNNVVPANTNYKLGSTESIGFFWKTNSDPDTLYNYHIYGQGCIICPTFDLSSTENTTVLDELVNEYFPTPSADWNEASDITTVNQTADLSGIVDSAYILSGSKTVTIKDINDITLSSQSLNTNCYWILNKKEGNSYVLPIDDDNEEYILETGEYFIYSNNSLTDLTILGAGTVIRLDSGTLDNPSVEVIPAEEVLAYGTSALEGYWYRIPSDVELTVTEQQFITLSPACTLRLQKASSWSLTLSSDPVDLTSYEISYKELNNDQYIKVPKVSGANLSWSGRAFLSFNIDKNVPLVLSSSNQQIWYKIGSNDFAAISGPANILSNIKVSYAGTAPVSTIVTDFYGNQTYLDLYQFDYYTSETEDIKYAESGEVTLDYSTSGDKTISIKLPAGDYILPIRAESDKFTQITLTYNSTDVEDMSGNSISSYTNIKKGQVIYCKLPLVATEEDLEISVTITERSVLTLLNIYKYNKPDNLSSSEFEDIIDRITELDQYYDLASSIVPRKVFDYTYVVPEDDRIDNPCDPMSFLLSNHIYNPFTICQWDTSSNTNIYIAGKK